MRGRKKKLGRNVNSLDLKMADTNAKNVERNA